MVGNIYNHRASRHSDENRAKCTRCHKMVIKHELKKHIARVHDAMPVQCNICNSMVKNLNSHNNKVHQGSKYSCNVCDKKFKTNGHLKSHSGIHLNNEPNTLHFFTTNKETNKRNHKNQEKIECSICLKKFSPLYLKHHTETVHTDSQKIKCTYCDNPFSKRNLDSHISRTI